MNLNSKPIPTVDLNFDRPRRRIGVASSFVSVLVAMSAAVSVAGSATPTRR